ncbi:MAG: hypothetical protein HGA75_02255, partial [Thiobacillus sp.]|nr:hypothetical protein [Thiobacillus sp.]
MALKQRLGQILREAGVYAHQHLNHWPEGRRIAILPSYDKATGSSLLRAWLVGNELVRQGWGVVLVPNQLDLKQRNRLLAHIEPDLIFLQKHRHQFNQPQLYPNYPCVFDLDDADFLDAEIFPIVERCCRGSAAVIAGSHYVADWCRQYNEDVTVVWTGTPYSHGRALSFNWERKGIVAWTS